MHEIEQLRNSINGKPLSLFIGAGVSVGSGLPTWDKLVISMYYELLKQDKLKGWDPFPNYLLAIAEWHLGQKAEPLEVTARKIGLHFEKSPGSKTQYIDLLKRCIYLPFSSGESVYLPDSEELRNKNNTLDAVASLCESGVVSDVITYNYDQLLDWVTGRNDKYIVHSSKKKRRAKGLPIYHVHGYVPSNGQGSRAEEIIFTEDQYNHLANGPYSWANMLQLKAMMSNTVLMIGISLADRNVRRLLDAVKRTNVDTNIFCILKRDDGLNPTVPQLRTIDKKARQYFSKFKSSLQTPGIKSQKRHMSNAAGKKKKTRADFEISGIFNTIQSQGFLSADHVLNELGIKPIYVDNYNEIGSVLNEISN